MGHSDGTTEGGHQIGPLFITIWSKLILVSRLFCRHKYLNVPNSALEYSSRHAFLIIKAFHLFFKFPLCCDEDVATVRQ